jgi:riboflavin biosynthesis pyrimidine reductase
MVATAPPLDLQSLVEPPAPDGPMRGGTLPERLTARYGGDLRIALRTDRPAVIVNFVSTIDGVTSYQTDAAAGGGEVSGFFEPDRFVMGLLRALSDVVLIGAGTLRADDGGSWTPQTVHPESAVDFAALRSSLGLRRNPLTAVLSASGSVDLSHPGLSDPGVEVLIVTTSSGAQRLAGQHVPANVEIRSTGDGPVEPQSVLDLLAERGAQLVLCEGGPRVLGEFLAAHLVDELFLTIAPQLAGRSPLTPRLSLVEDMAFSVPDSRWARLAGLRRAGDHLFARYSFS